MNSLVMRDHVARRLHALRDDRAVLAVFSATLCLSALLLFSIQPVVAKMVLPKLGGSPSVWAVTMCFFQAVLLAGYCYAHVLNHHLAARHAPLVHLGLCTLAMLMLPFAIATGAEPRGGESYLWLIGVLAPGVGLPFFAVSASAPLLQAWFARSGHPQAKDPYFLYSASNIGSLLALLAYPVVIEPSIGLSLQAKTWTGGFLLLVLLLGACAAIIERALVTGSSVAPDEDARPGASVANGTRLAWVGLAFVPSGLLVAFTSYLTTDIASTPFLWVIPLALFLATFILVFRDRPLLPHSLLLILQPAVMALALFGLVIVGNQGWLIGVIGGFGAFFVTAMVCHRELYERRPQSRHLTEFYLWMSLGGVLGGVFAALIAPQLFHALYELPLLLVLGMACRPGLFSAIGRREMARAGLLAGAGILAMLALVVGARLDLLPAALLQKGAALWVIACALMMLAAHARPLPQALLAALAGIATAVLPSAMNSGFAERSFFGVHRVVDIEDAEVRVLIHGTTVHGAQRLKVSHLPISDAPPATYYYPGSPMAGGLKAARVAVGGDGGLNVGIVGLGAGSMACYAEARDSWRFFEIDPVVVKLARDSQLFSFLSRCQPNAEIVLGDARLTLAKEPAGRFDYLLIDAFSSDSVPVHMLTREAVLMFLGKLKADGVLALHITNRHLDLERVAGAVARSIPGTYAAVANDQVDASLDHARSKVLFITRTQKSMALVGEWAQAVDPPRADGVAWTDDYSNILSVLWRRASP